MHAHIHSSFLQFSSFLCPIHQVGRSKVSVEEYGIISQRWVCVWKPHVPLWSKRWEVPCHHCLCMTATSGLKWGVTFLLSEHQTHDSYLGKKDVCPLTYTGRDLSSRHVFLCPLVPHDEETTTLQFDVSMSVDVQRVQKQKVDYVGLVWKIS